MSASPRFFDFDWDSEEYSEINDDPVDGWQSEWNWQSCGFQFGRFQLSSQPVTLQNIEDGSEGPTIRLVFGEMEIGVIPYWSLVLPQTLLSAYLLLWKPRKRGDKLVSQVLVALRKVWG